MDLNSGAHIKYQMLYHLEWCPKYRYNIFGKEMYRQDYEFCLELVAARHGIQIIEMAVNPEHVHLLVSAPPTMSVSQALQFLKGGSSFEFMHLHEEFRLRYPKGHLLSPGKFCRTVGDVDFETTKDYIRNQNPSIPHEVSHQTKLADLS